MSIASDFVLAFYFQRRPLFYKKKQFSTEFQNVKRVKRLEFSGSTSFSVGVSFLTSKTWFISKKKKRKNLGNDNAAPTCFVCSWHSEHLFALVVDSCFLKRSYIFLLSILFVFSFPLLPFQTVLPVVMCWLTQKLYFILLFNVSMEMSQVLDLRANHNLLTQEYMLLNVYIYSMLQELFYKIRKILKRNHKKFIV